ncbi:hypothetical protein [Parasynechococcus sp.]|jgi:multisubunit Na+/H+ antiporter MnhF subunit|uniref:hypothetical protein n=1 Tax=Parasynechococcus sp. TaxID=3101203 RepID=UPI003704BCDC
MNALTTLFNLRPYVAELTVVYCMLFISFIPLIAVARSKDTPTRIAIASSFSTKLAMMILVFGVFRGDWMIACIGAFVLIVGDAGMLILSLMEMEI